jgi:hypothetical protein
MNKFLNVVPLKIFRALNYTHSKLAHMWMPQEGVEHDGVPRRESRTQAQNSEREAVPTRVET